MPGCRGAPVVRLLRAGDGAEAEDVEVDLPVDARDVREVVDLPHRPLAAGPDEEVRHPLRAVGQRPDRVVGGEGAARIDEELPAPRVLDDPPKVLEFGVDLVLLDNMPPATLREAVALVEIELPRAARVAYPRWQGKPYRQCLWMLEGELQLDYGDERFRLAAGDCLDFGVDRPLGFKALGARGCRYLDRKSVV